MIKPFSLVVFSVLLFGCAPNRNESVDEFPSRTVTIVCPWAAGGGTDRVSRFWAEALQKKFEGNPFVVVNRTGGGGAVGHSAGALAKPDGYTMTTITFELSTMHSMGISELTFKDYACLIQMNADPAAIIVQNDAPWKSLQEFLADVKAKAGTKEKLKMSGTATGGAWDLARAGMLQAASLAVDSVIWVPTEGSAPSLQELLGGHIDAVCCSVPEAAQNLEGGTLRALSVMADERLPKYSDIPTAKEEGVDWVAVGWRGLALPKDTPEEIVKRLEATCLEIAQSEEHDEFMKQQGFGVMIRNSEDFKTFLADQDSQWKVIVEATGYAR